MKYKVIKALAISFVAQEAAIVINYYLQIGLGKGEMIQAQHKYRWVKGQGLYFAAPLWEPEVGVIQSPTKNDEFTIRHEVGHSLHPRRPLFCLAGFPIWFGLPWWQALPWCFAVLWLGEAVSERWADRYALQHCSLEGLKDAFQRFDRDAADPVICFPPDVHPSNALRAYSIKNRIAQLEAEPNKAPAEIPLPLKIQLLNTFRIVK